MNAKVGAGGLTLGELLGRRQRVRELHLPPCGPDVLAVLATLPEIRALSTKLCISRKADWKLCQEAVEEFKRQRPDAKLNITFRQDRPASPCIDFSPSP